MAIELLCLDADDTLWVNERHFQTAADAFCAVMAPHAGREAVIATLEAVSAANVGLYGFGAKGFTLSMIEAALSLSGNTLSAGELRQLLAIGRDLHDYPMELLDGVAETLPLLADRLRLVLVTKGDLIHQEAKLAASGLGPLFEAVEIVSVKDRATFERIFARARVQPSQAAMAGDSVKSDIIPALAAGAWGLLIPGEHVSHHERADAPQGEPRFRRLARFADLLGWVEAAG